MKRNTQAHMEQPSATESRWLEEWKRNENEEEK